MQRRGAVLSANAPTCSGKDSNMSRKMRAAKRQAQPVEAVEPLAYSIRQFCKAHSISKELFFKMRRKHLGPAEMRIGTRVLISHESAAAWRRAREQAAAAAA
jgi:hypothetical protein